MKIETIKINNYKAFYGNHEIKLSGKNLLVYGENGSGKSSFYNALNVFFNSSINNVNLEENIFIDNALKGTSHIEISFKDKSNSSLTQNLRIDKNVQKVTSLFVSDANKVKAFFDYKKLLKTHFIDKEKVDIFDILINDILYHSINNFTSNPLGEDWEKIQTLKNSRKGTHDFSSCEEILKQFNLGLKEKLVEIKDISNKFVKYFNNNVIIDFEFNDIEIWGKEKALKNNQVILKVDFYNKHLDTHHTFFNEARLTSLGISLYLASILSNPLGIPFKILVLDDLLIGLDMSNRIPFIKILQESFSEFQIIITTYDKAWFEVMKTYFSDWEKIEMYSKKLDNNNFEIPIIYQNSLDFIIKSEEYLSLNDYKASAVYLRSEFEKVIKRLCNKLGLKVKYNMQAFKIDSNDFWESIKENTNLSSELIEKVELHRSIVMNPFSHYTLEKPEFKAELEESINVMKELRKTLESVKQVNIVNQLKQNIDKLTNELSNNQKTINGLKKKLELNSSNSEEVSLSPQKQEIISQSTESIKLLTNPKTHILDKLIVIDKTEDLNQFLINEISNNIESISIIELEQVFDELRLKEKLSLLNLSSEANLIRIFNKKSWNIEEKKIWCNFIVYLYNQNKIQDPLLIQKLEEKEVLKREYGGWNNQEEFIKCEFEEEIPF